MVETDIKRLLEARITLTRAKELLIELVKVPSPQTELLEDEPLLKAVTTDDPEAQVKAGDADVGVRLTRAGDGPGLQCEIIRRDDSPRGLRPDAVRPSLRADHRAPGPCPRT